jgi:hypothetical protein
LLRNLALSDILFYHFPQKVAAFAEKVREHSLHLRGLSFGYKRVDKIASAKLEKVP